MKLLTFQKFLTYLNLLNDDLKLTVWDIFSSSLDFWRSISNWELFGSSERSLNILILLLNAVLLLKDFAHCWLKCVLICLLYHCWHLCDCYLALLLNLPTNIITSSLWGLIESMVLSFNKELSVTELNKT